MERIIFKIFKKIAGIFGGKGFAKLPGIGKLYRFFYGKLKPQGIVEVFSEGHKIFINSKDTGIAPYLLMGKNFAQDEIDLLKKILKPGMIFVDIGANIGYFSLVSAKLVGDQGQVYAFEPDPDNFNLLEKNIKVNNYKNIIAVNKAVSDKSGKARLYLEPDNLCGHSLVVKNGNKFVEVEIIILDEFLKDKKIDVIKIDVEGFEPVVLEGMKNIIKNNDKISIITEFYPEAIKKAGYSPEKYKNDLKDLGFKLNEFGEGKKLINIFAQKS